MRAWEATVDVARHEREFGNKQADMLDDVTANLLEIDGKARDGLLAIKAGDVAQTLIDLTDIRGLALDARDKIGRARRGDYDHG